MAEFAERHPAITLELDLTPRRVDLVGENFDLAIRMGALDDEGTLSARRLAAFSTGLYATPAYLARGERPNEPEALMEHDTLRVLRRDGSAQPWVLSRGEARWEEGLPPARLTSDAPDLLGWLAAEGIGIVAIPDHFAQPAVARGELEPVLPGWCLPPVEAWAVFPGRRLMPARTRVFLDALAAEFSGPRCEAEAERVAAVRRWAMPE